MEKLKGTLGPFKDNNGRMVMLVSDAADLSYQVVECDVSYKIDIIREKMNEFSDKLGENKGKLGSEYCNNLYHTLDNLLISMDSYISLDKWRELEESEEEEDDDFLYDEEYYQDY